MTQFPSLGWEGIPPEADPPLAEGEGEKNYYLHPHRTSPIEGEEELSSYKFSFKPRRASAGIRCAPHCRAGTR